MPAQNEIATDKNDTIQQAYAAASMEVEAKQKLQKLIGKNNQLLALKIPSELLQALEAEAKSTCIPLPQFVRDVLTWSVLDRLSVSLFQEVAAADFEVFEALLDKMLQNAEQAAQRIREKKAEIAHVKQEGTRKQAEYRAKMQQRLQKRSEIPSQIIRLHPEEDETDS